MKISAIKLIAPIFIRLGSHFKLQNSAIYNIIMGKMTGKTAVAKKLEQLGMKATDEQIADIVKAVKAEGSIRKWSITDDIFEKIARGILVGKWVCW